MGCGATICRYKRFLVLVLTPLILIPIPVVIQRSEAYATYILLLMAVYWITEVLPLGITALIPVVLTPLFKIATSKQLCPAYMKDTNVLFMGGLMVATAVEHWNLHKRIALAVMIFVGTSPRRLMLGFMLPTWFLSMWISNTATTAMMIPMVEAVLIELRRSPHMETEEQEEINMDADESESEGDPLNTTVVSPDKLDEKAQNMGKAMTVCIAYSASCGGIGTLTGTGPNLILNNEVTSNYDSRANFSFGTWMLYAIPIAFVALIVVWLWLQIWFFGIRQFFVCKSNKENEERVRNVIRNNYKALGPVSFAEGSCLFFFVVLVFLWVTKEPGVPGWVAWFTNPPNTRFPSDAQPAIFVAIMLFMWPSYNPLRSRTTPTGEQIPIPAEKTLLTWGVIQKSFPWNIVLLLGGGFAVAETIKSAGLSTWIGKQMEVLEGIPVGVLVFVVTLGSACFSEITSNTATATIILPILNQLAKCINIHPFLLMLPGAVGCSLAFSLPVATPPNSIVFSKGYLKVTDMIKCGMFLDLFTVCIVTAATLSYGTAFFKLGSFPDWAGQCQNSTLAAVANETITAL